jgi:hypothetical protein
VLRQHEQYDSMPSSVSAGDLQRRDVWSNILMPHELEWLLFVRGKGTQTRSKPRPLRIGHPFELLRIPQARFEDNKNC